MRKPRLSETTCKKLMNGEYFESKDHQFNVESEWSKELSAYQDVLYRMNIHTGEVDRFVLTAPEGLWAFSKRKD